MPYAIKNPADRTPLKKLSLRYVASPSDAAPDEVVVPDADVRPQAVYDASTRRLRQRTAAEEAAEKSREAAEGEGIASALATLRASANPEVQALLRVLSDRGVL